MITKGNIYVGIAGWSYADWEGIVYPNSTLDQLAYVCRFVDVIEINSTFYKPPVKKISQSWLQRTRHKKDFFFTAKLHRDFTHEGRIDEQMVNDFKAGFEPLLEADKLKYLLVQFRYDFDDDFHNKRLLWKIVKHFSDLFRIVVEVRHSSWQQPENLEYLKELAVTVCNPDYPVGETSFYLPDCTIGTHGYCRLHGRNADKWFTKASRDETYNYYYSPQELRQLCERIEELAFKHETYIVIGNNHYKGAELANALELKHLLTGLKMEIPEGLLQTYPHLSEIAKNPNLF